MLTLAHPEQKRISALSTTVINIAITAPQICDIPFVTPPPDYSNGSELVAARERS